VTTGKSPKEEKRYKAALHYSGMAIQFFAMIAFGAWIGQKLDAYFSTPRPFITIFLILLFSTGYFIKLYKDLTQ
jgi:F0F1-type ATP synthase assembly protein I